MADHRLQTIHHKYPSGATLSKFDYTYDAVGNILTWRQQADNDAVLWVYRYDSADQLIGALKHATDPQQTMLKRYAYAYDPGGNRTAEQIDDTVTGASHDNMNRLLSQQPAGGLQFAGTVSEPAAVTVQGVRATVAGDNTFRATVPVAPGTNVIAVNATDASGNSTVREYDVDNIGSPRTLNYDANGNLLSDGTLTFEWNAAGRVASVSKVGERHEYAYNGLGELKTVAGIVNGVAAETHLVWDGGRLIAEVGTSSRAILDHGTYANGAGQFVVLDHRDSPVAVTDSAGVVLGRYESEPFGKMTVTSGARLSPFGVGGLWMDDAMDLAWAHYRVYLSHSGRWASEDPFGFVDGPNLYQYARNGPVSFIDPSGAAATAAARFITDAATCSYAMGDLVNRHYRPNENNNRYAHCLASCIIKQVCPGGGATAWLAGLGKEVWDVGQCRLGGRKASCDSAFERQDFIDNAFGRECPANQTCLQRCASLKDQPDKR